MPDSIPQSNLTLSRRQPSTYFVAPAASLSDNVRNFQQRSTLDVRKPVLVRPQDIDATRFSFVLLSLQHQFLLLLQSPSPRILPNIVSVRENWSTIEPRQFGQAQGLAETVSSNAAGQGAVAALSVRVQFDDEVRGEIYSSDTTSSHELLHRNARRCHVLWFARTRLQTRRMSRTGKCCFVASSSAFVKACWREASRAALGCSCMTVYTMTSCFARSELAPTIRW